MGEQSFRRIVSSIRASRKSADDIRRSAAFKEHMAALKAGDCHPAWLLQIEAELKAKG